MLGHCLHCRCTPHSHPPTPTAAQTRAQQRVGTGPWSMLPCDPHVSPCTTDLTRHAEGCSSRTWADHITAATGSSTAGVSELSATRDAPLQRSSACAVSPCHLHSSMRREQQWECAAASTPCNGRDFCSLWLNSKQQHSNGHKHRHESMFNTEYSGGDLMSG